MNKSMNLPAMQKIMMEFEKQSEMMEMKVCAGIGAATNCTAAWAGGWSEYSEECMRWQPTVNA